MTTVEIGLLALNEKTIKHQCQSQNDELVLGAEEHDRARRGECDDAFFSPRNTLWAGIQVNFV